MSVPTGGSVRVLAAAVALALPLAARAQMAAWDTYGGATSRIGCRGRPVLLTGSHTDTTLTGACTVVRVAGNHNDVTLTVAPGATIEITGAHNDVWWHGPGGAARPALLDHGFSNTFHHQGDED